MQSQVELADLKKAINAKLEQLITITSTKDIDQDYTGYVVKFSDGVARVMEIKRARIGQRLTFHVEWEHGDIMLSWEMVKSCQLMV